MTHEHQFLWINNDLIIFSIYVHKTSIFVHKNLKKLNKKKNFLHFLTLFFKPNKFYIHIFYSMLTKNSQK